MFKHLWLFYLSFINKFNLSIGLHLKLPWSNSEIWQPVYIQFVVIFTGRTE